MVEIDPNDMIGSYEQPKLKSGKKLRPKFTDKSSAEEDFINEMTRKFLVEWCHYAIVQKNSKLPWAPGDRTEGLRPYLDFAKAKGWVSSDETKILAAGWKTAAAFLRR